jgi:hypothetical protein
MRAIESSTGGSEPKLTPKQEKAIAALLAHPTIKEAAAAVGIGESSILRWMGQDYFHSAYLEARRSAVQQAIARAQVITSDAMKVLHEVMQDTSQIGSTRVSAAKAAMDYAIRGIELEDHEQRLQEIERLLQDRNRR